MVAILVLPRSVPFMCIPNRANADGFKDGGGAVTGGGDGLTVVMLPWVPAPGGIGKTDGGVDRLVGGGGDKPGVVGNDIDDTGGGGGSRVAAEDVGTTTPAAKSAARRTAEMALVTNAVIAAICSWESVGWGGCAHRTMPHIQHTTHTLTSTIRSVNWK